MRNAPRPRYATHSARTQTLAVVALIATVGACARAPSHATRDDTPSPAIASRVAPRTDSTSSPLADSAMDAQNVTELRASGGRVEREHLVMWYPRDSLSEAHADALADSIDRGLGAMQALIRAPRPWQRMVTRKVVYWLGARRFISHASGVAEVYISMYHVRRGQAPYLHEAAHELLSAKEPYYPEEFPDSASAAAAAVRLPTWLIEGIAEHVARLAAERAGVVEGDIFRLGGPSNVDRVCATRARGPRGAVVLSVVGTVDRGATLDSLLSSSARREVAPTFYACSYSFTMFLSDRMGLQQLIEMLPKLQSNGLDDEVMRATRRPLGELRGEWIGNLGIGGGQ